MLSEPDSLFLLLVNKLEVAGPWPTLVLIACRECFGGWSMGSWRSDYGHNSGVVKGDDPVPAVSAGFWLQAAAQLGNWVVVSFSGPPRIGKKVGA